MATREAAYISGAVFSVIANGRVTLYSDPVPTNTIKKDDVPWTMEELIKAVPEKLLKDYVSIVKLNEWGSFVAYGLSHDSPVVKPVIIV